VDGEPDRPDRSWLERPFRVLDYLYNAEIDTYPMEEVVAACQRMAADVIHFHCMYNMRGGLDEDGMYFRARCATRANRDVLGEFLPLARQAGIRTVVYANLHWFTKPFVDAHPDWAVLKQDGSRFERLYGDDDSTCCINTPWREWSFRLLEDVCAYPVDGVFFDGPIVFTGRGGCYCASCQAGFRARYGTPIPTLDRKRPEDFARLREFGVRSMEDYYRDAMAVLHAARPGVVGYANCANVAEPDYTAGRANRRLMAHLDCLLAEGGFMYGRVTDGGFLRTGASSRLYETQSGGKPCINAVSMAYSPWRWVAKTPPETRSIVAAAATGVNPYYAVFMQGKTLPGVGAAAEVYRFLQRHAEYYAGSESLATVALLQSGQSLSMYGGVDIPWADLSYQKAERAEAVGNFTRSFYGFYELLLRARIPFDILDEEALEGGLPARYRGLVLPNAACLSDRQCALLQEYVQQGGLLVADFESSHYDQTGRRRRDFGLAQVFGASSLNKVSSLRRWDYVFVAPDGGEYFGPMPVDFLPAPQHSIEVTCGPAARIAAVFSEPIVSNIVPAAERSSQPFLIAHRYGQGQSLFLPCTFGEFYHEHHPAAYPAIVGQLLGNRVALPVRVDSPVPLLDVRPRWQPAANRTLLHLIGFQPSADERCIPVTGTRLEVRAAAAPQRVRALRLDRDLPCRTADGWAGFTLPYMEEFEVIVVEW
jgi:hypothetical protein